ncbi:MAG: hypothetical protein P8X82_01085 [Gemmatimonadales bacterium]
MIRTLVSCLALGFSVARASSAQEPAREPPFPVIDTIIVITQDVYGPSEASSSFLFQLANTLHFTTRRSVVGREILFKAGAPYDSALVAETERNLRRMGIFRRAVIDTVRMDGRLAAIVATADGWTTEIQLNMRFTAGTFSWATGLIERNFLGRAAQAGVTYRDEPDRNAITLRAGSDRTFGSPVAVRGFYDDLSDGNRGVWGIGVPFRAWGDRHSFGVAGYAGHERVLRYRDGEIAETYQRRSFIQTGQISTAPLATSSKYLRVGLAGQYKREEYVPASDTGQLLPDSVSGAVGAFAELAWARFMVVTHYNGFDREYDLDLSTRVALSTWLAPSFWGYPATGLGLGLSLQTGASLGTNFARLEGRANGLFTSAGLDSGQVWVALTLATRLIPKNATVFHIEVGAQENPPPELDFDLGHGSGPRLFGPHSFTGSRSAWGSLEHRAFLVDEVIGLLGIGVAAFLDYGGAWYEDQSPRLGGDIGFGLRIGATRATGPNVGRIDFGYRFGDGTEGKRWAVSFGRGFSF